MKMGFKYFNCGLVFLLMPSLNVGAFLPEGNYKIVKVLVTLNRVPIGKEQEAAYRDGSACMADGYPGICIIWKKCFNLALDIQDKNYPPLCSFNRLEPIICCTSCELTKYVSKLVLSPRHGILWQTDQISWNKCIEYSLLPYHEIDHNKCTYKKRWIETQGCFKFSFGCVSGAGGRDAKRAEFPHMALLGYGESKNTSQWLCGGTLLNDRFILTAGHCISSPAVGNIHYVALGILKRSDPKELWQTYEVQKIIPHPQYRPPAKYHDIALLKTRERISFNENVLPSCLPNLAEVPGDDSAVAPGWGYTGPRTPLADNLQAVKVSKFSHDKCSQLFKKHRLLTRGFSEDTQMCYGDENQIRDTCEGDSGGPLLVPGQIYHFQRTVIGVTSYGPDCGRAGQAGVYTRVQPYVPWIDSIIWSSP